MGTRGCRGVSRDCGDVCSVSESRTITLKVRRRASARHSRVQGGESGLLRRCSVRESRTITLKSRGRSSVRVAEVTIPGRISSAIILASAVRTAAAPKAHLFFPYLEYRVVSVMCGELGIEEGDTIFKGGKAPPEAVSGRATYTTAAAISAAIYSRLDINAVIFQTQSMLLQASRRVFP